MEYHIGNDLKTWNGGEGEVCGVHVCGVHVCVAAVSFSSKGPLETGPTMNLAHSSVPQGAGASLVGFPSFRPAEWPQVPGECFVLLSLPPPAFVLGRAN